MRNLALALLVPVFCMAQGKPASRSTFNAHNARIAYSPDQTLLAASENEDISLFSPQTLVKVRKLGSHRSAVTSLFFTTNNKHLISCGLDSKLNYWDHATGVIKKYWTAPDPLLDAKLLTDDRVAMVTGNELIIYDFSIEKVITTTSSNFQLVDVTVVPEEKIIVTGASNGDVFMYDFQGKIVGSFRTRDKLSAIDISPSGLVIAVGFKDGHISMYDRKGTIAGDFSDAKKWIRHIWFSQDSKYFIAGDDWGNSLVYSVEGKTVAEKFKSNDNPILAAAFSPDGSSMISVSQYEISTWDVKSLNIASVFRLKDQKDRTPPQIYVSNPQNIQDDKVRVYKDVIEVRGTLMDESGIRGLKVNGIDVPIKENNNFVIIQPLAMNDNPFVIEARDINDNISIKRFIVQRKNTLGEEYDVSKARNFLFIVGINNYEHWPRLNNAVKDANDISNALLTSYNFEFDNLTLIKDEQATRSNIYKSLRSLVEKVTPQDNLLVYFSGHGYFDELLNEGYWIPVDAHTGNSGEYLSNADILKIIGNIDSQHTFLIADACFSGSLFSESNRGYAENVEKYKSRWGLASGRLEVVSDGSVGNNSPFASATIEFLKGNNKDKVAISELVQYVKLKVAENSKQTPLGNPLKVAGDEGGEMVLYRKKS